jgi:hypothetical protein
LANQQKEEEVRERCMARAGHPSDGLKTPDDQIAADMAVFVETKSFHRDLFPEEYDHSRDSAAEACLRSRGHNPKPLEYQVEVNRRREELGFEPLTNDGMAPSNKTFLFIWMFLLNGNQIPLTNLIKTVGLHRSVH